MARGGQGPHIKQDVQMHHAAYSGSAPGVATGTFINWGTNQQAQLASAYSGGRPAAGFALMGQRWGTFTLKTAEYFDIVDDPMGVGQVNSGVYNVGQTLFLSGSGLSNFSTTPPAPAHGVIVQQVGVMIDDPNSGIAGGSRRFRIRIGMPFVYSGSGSPLLRPWIPGTA